MHVSMGTIAARKARQITGNVANVLAIELLAACQALDFRRSGAKGGYRLVRSRAHLEHDHELAPDIDSARRLIVSGEVERAAREAVGRVD